MIDFEMDVRGYSTLRVTKGDVLSPSDRGTFGDALPDQLAIWHDVEELEGRSFGAEKEPFVVTCGVWSSDPDDVAGAGSDYPLTRGALEVYSLVHVMDLLPVDGLDPWGSVVTEASGVIPDRLSGRIHHSLTSL